jgi:hypothetical protein
MRRPEVLSNYVLVRTVHHYLCAALSNTGFWTNSLVSSPAHAGSLPLSNEGLTLGTITHRTPNTLDSFFL